MLDDLSSAVALDIVVVGGGIAGLASAYALQQAGHNVRVLEKTDGRQRITRNDDRGKGTGGIRSPPNMTRILDRWGMGQRLGDVAYKCGVVTLYEGCTGKLVGKIPLEQFAPQFGADLMFVQHGDLYEILYDFAIQAGVKVLFNTNVTGVDSGDVLVLDNKQRVDADVIIGADGPRSIVRRDIGGDEPERSQTGYLTLTLTVPTATLDADDELRCIWRDDDSQYRFWFGDGYCMHLASFRSGSQVSGTLVYPIDDNASSYNEGWSESYPLSHFKPDWEKFEPRLRKLLQQQERVTATVHFDNPDLESTLCDRSHVVLVGEAAYPALPSGQYKAAYAIEDALTLGLLFARITDRAQVPQVLCAYEEIRGTRSASIVPREKEKRRLLSLPHGPEQEQRDTMWKHPHPSGEKWVDLDIVASSRLSSHDIEVYMYDAADAVQDWWSTWGGLLDRHSPTKTGEKGPQSGVVISVSCDSKEDGCSFIREE
uniref:FAD-binding protein n=1 Tax=Volvariella volvacea TaxID=36659 RepID=M9Z533_9AGAR|nr:FAD-binding protein [Volvariella volvacea]